MDIKTINNTATSKTVRSQEGGKKVTRGSGINSREICETSVKRYTILPSDKEGVMYGVMYGVILTPAGFCCLWSGDSRNP